MLKHEIKKYSGSVLVDKEILDFSVFFSCSRYTNRFANARAREKNKLNKKDRCRQNREKIFIRASFYTFIGNYSILDYFNILLILELNSEFGDFKLWD